MPLLCSAKRLSFSISSSPQVPEALAVAGGGADAGAGGSGAECGGCVCVGVGIGAGAEAEAGVGCLLLGKGAETGVSGFGGAVAGGGIAYVAGYGYG